jgi:cell division protein FtsW
VNLFNNSYLSKANAATEGKLAETFSLDNAKQAIIDKVKGDRFIWGIIILLSLISILVVYSATGSLAYKKYHGNTEYFLFKQVGFSVLGLVLIYLIHQVNYYFFSTLYFLEQLSMKVVDG